MATAPSQASVRATAFLGAKKWLLTKHGESAYKNFITQFPEVGAILEKRGLMPISWVPMSDFNKLFEAIVAYFGPNGTTLFSEMAKWIAIDALTTTMKVFMKLGTPAFIASAFPGTFSHYFTVGKWANLSLTPKRLEGEITGDSKDNGAARCIATMSWARGALEYSGAKNLVQVHPECIFKGGSRCSFIYTWE